MDSGQLLLPHFNVDRFGLIFFELDDKGRIIEDGACKEIFKNPKEPYTKELFSSSYLK